MDEILIKGPDDKRIDWELEGANEAFKDLIVMTMNLIMFVC